MKSKFLTIILPFLITLNKNYILGNFLEQVFLKITIFKSWLIKLTDAVPFPSQKQRFLFIKRIIGIFRLTHFLPVITITTIGATLAYFSLGGFQPILSYLFIVLTIFFEQSFLGIQNDYLDHKLDAVYEKRKAIVDGWVSVKTAFWSAIICFILFTGFSVALAFYSKIGFWTVVYIQGANLVGLFYNLYAKHKPISLLPYFLGFPLVPIYIWLNLGGFEMIYLWFLPLIAFVSLPAHIANELPDIKKDEQNGLKNFVVTIGKTPATIVYWLGVFLGLLELIILYFLYEINIWAFLGTIISSTIFAVGGVVLLWRNNWNTNTLIFNIVTVSIGIQIVGFLTMIHI
ncbi:MAG: hypothetical protein GF308_05340 [Candidatus Heimdallarchaeota archaeon]|nr:hypothetical protein [Candidatus Heimdallarchaeota archaeon]